MTQNKCFELLTIVETKLAKKCTHMRRPIPAIERLAIALR
jgi:hypothetical protein